VARGREVARGWVGARGREVANALPVFFLPKNSFWC